MPERKKEGSNSEALFIYYELERMSRNESNWIWLGEPVKNQDKFRTFNCAQKREKGRFIVGETIFFTRRDEKGRITHVNVHGEIVQLFEDTHKEEKFAVIRYFYTLHDIQSLHAAALSKIEGNLNDREIFAQSAKETIRLEDVSSAKSISEMCILSENMVDIYCAIYFLMIVR